MREVEGRSFGVEEKHRRVAAYLDAKWDIRTDLNILNALIRSRISLILSERRDQTNGFYKFEANVRALYKQMARITITPTWARYYDFGAGRLPTFLRRLIDSTSS